MDRSQFQVTHICRHSVCHNHSCRGFSTFLKFEWESGDSRRKHIERIYKIWFGHLSLSLKFEYDPISCCWDIQLLIFWGHLQLEVIFISSISIFVWSPELKFKIWGGSDEWLLRYSTFNILRSSSIGGRLPLEVVFISTIFFFFGLVP